VVAGLIGLFFYCRYIRNKKEQEEIAKKREDRSKKGDESKRLKANEMRQS
jgi:hypothetical protein